MVIAIHKTFEKHKKSGERDIVVCLAGQSPIRGIKKLSEWQESLPKRSTIRVISGDACDPLLAHFADSGHAVLSANWHATGIEKGSEPQEIANQIAALPAEIFRPLVFRADLIELKALVDQRNIFVDERTRAVLRIKAMARAQGMVADVDYDEATNELVAEARNVRGRTKQGTYINIVTDLEHSIAIKAAKISECILFNKLAGINDSWTLAAEIVVLLRGLEGFANVAKVWKYAGHSVEDGKCPKRTKGKVVSHNTRLLTVMWQLGSVMMMRRKQPWRSLFEQYREQELAAHDVKHPGCKTKQGHSTARALRKMRKEFLKQWFLEVKRSQKRPEDQLDCAPLGAGHVRDGVQNSCASTSSLAESKAFVKPMYPVTLPRGNKTKAGVKPIEPESSAANLSGQKRVGNHCIRAGRSGKKTIAWLKPTHQVSLAALPSTSNSKRTIA